MKPAFKQTVHICQIKSLLILALIQIISSINANPPCNIFPKFFGGGVGDTFIYQIDVFNDYLALGGHTLDNQLTGLTSTSPFPYIALASISMSTMYYWSKVFSLMPGSSIYGL